MSAKVKKVLIIILSIIVVLAIGVVILLYRAGVFADPQVTLGERGPYSYVFMSQTGSFENFYNAQQDLDKIVQEESISVGILCGVFMDDPAKVKQEDLRWQVGYLVKDSLSVDPPLEFSVIPKGLYAIASIKAHPAVAAFKTYPALNKWIKENNYKVMGPALELYREDGVVEAMFPVKKE